MTWYLVKHKDFLPCTFISWNIVTSNSRSLSARCCTVYEVHVSEHVSWISVNAQCTHTRDVQHAGWMRLEAVHYHLHTITIMIMHLFICSDLELFRKCYQSPSCFMCVVGTTTRFLLKWRIKKYNSRSQNFIMSFIICSPTLHQTLWGGLTKKECDWCGT
jgi:hypothetical protein